MRNFDFCVRDTLGPSIYFMTYGSSKQVLANATCCPGRTFPTRFWVSQPSDGGGESSLMEPEVSSDVADIVIRRHCAESSQDARMRANVDIVDKLVDFPESSTANGDVRITLTRIASEYGMVLSASLAIASLVVSQL